MGVARLAIMWAVMLTACGSDESANVEASGVAHGAIVGGQLEPGFPSVGIVQSNGGCTGTLIGARTVLTAGHCLGGSGTFTVGGTSYTATTVIPHPAYCGGSCNDLGLLLLGEDVPVSPSPLHVSALVVGESITAVGFGYTAAAAGDFGTKRSVVNLVDAINPTTFVWGGTSSTCSGDSGGPTFASVGGEKRVAGVHSMANIVCSTAYDMRIDIYVDWINSAAGGDVASGDPCEGVTCTTPPGPCYVASGSCIAGTCSYAPHAFGVACDDGDACSGGDRCDGAGVCIPGADTCAEPPTPPSEPGDNEDADPVPPDGESLQPPAGVDQGCHNVGAAPLLQLMLMAAWWVRRSQTQARTCEPAAGCQRLSWRR